MLQGGYPGVYVQEIPSGIRTVAAAPTSNLAIVGQFPRGPIDEAVRVNSWGDVERLYGGLDRRFVSTYALQDFYLQGGAIAYVVRVGITQASAQLTATEDALTVTAQTAGGTGNSIRYGISHNVDGTFDLVIFESGVEGARREFYPNLSHDFGSARNALSIVGAAPEAGGSSLVTLSGFAHRPAETIPGTAAADMAHTQLGANVLQGGAGDAFATDTVASAPLQGLVLQATGEIDTDAGAQVTIADGDGATFDLTYDPGGGALPVLENVTPETVAAEVAARDDFPFRVLTNRGPLRRPDNGVYPFGMAAGEVPSAFTVLNDGGGTPAARIEAANGGAWGNEVRVGVAANPAGGFDIIAAEYSGTDRLKAEAYRGLSATDGDPRNAADVVNSQSLLIRIEDLDAIPAETSAGVSIDDLDDADLTALEGGEDGVVPGDPAWAGNALTAFTGSQEQRSGIFALDGIDPEIFNLMIIPEAPMMADQGSGAYAAAASYCAANLAFLLVDHPDSADGASNILNWDISAILGSDLARNAALCFPKVRRSDPLAGGRARDFPASGSIAGVFARTDAQRGVWKAPAGNDASVAGALPSVKLTNLEHGRLNQRGLNAMRAFPNIGTVNFGARTLAGSDALASEWKYVPVRRTALFIERSLKTGLGWAVFEPNDEPLWAQIRLNVGAFMQDLYVRGAFAGGSPREAYLVKCDGETTSQQDVNSGIVNIVVGFQPLKPAEFVVLKLTQLAGRLAN